MMYKMLFLFIITITTSIKLTKCSNSTESSTRLSTNESTLEEIVPFELNDKKLQIKISWSVSPYCNLIPIFESKNLNVTCDLQHEKPIFFVSYRFIEGLNTKPFRVLFLENSFPVIIKNLTNLPINQNSLFEWDLCTDELRLVHTKCNYLESKTDCFEHLDNDTEIMLRIIKENSSEIYLRNDTLDYLVFDNCTVLFEREPDGNEYLKTYVKIQLSNGTFFNIPFNNGQVFYDFSEIAGETFKASFNGKWKNSFHDLSTLNATIGVELNHNLFKLAPIRKQNQNFVIYNIDLDIFSLTTQTHPVSIQIPFKVKILSTTKLNTTTIRIDWTKPLGIYDKILLVCYVDVNKSSNFYTRNSVSGQCSNNPSIAGHVVLIKIFVIDSSVEYTAAEVKKLIEPDPVRNIRLLSATNTTLNINWQLPNGHFTSLILSCIQSKTNVKDFQMTAWNLTNEATCTNLQPNTTYKVEIIVLVSFNSETIGIKREEFYSTIPDVGNLTELSMTELTKVNFSIYEPAQVVDVLNKLQTNLTNFKNQTHTENELVLFLNESSIVIENIALRNTINEREDLVLSFIDLIDNFMDEPSFIFQKIGQNSNKLTNSLEIIANKLDLTPKRKLEFGQDFKNFFVRTQIINSSTVEYSDLGFATTYVDKESIFDITSDSIEYFMNLTGLKFAAYFDKKSIDNMVMNNKTPRITYVGYSSPKLFVGGKAKKLEQFEIDCLNETQVAPNVISASQIKGIQPTDELISIIYEQQKNEKYCDRRKINYSYECVHWDYELNDWNNLGCRHLMIEKDNKVLHKCSCNHTTNFALLMVADSIGFCDWCDNVLFYISIIGVSVSIVGLLATILYDLFIAFLPSTTELKPVGLMERYSSMSKQYLRVISTWCLTLLIMNCTYIAFSLFKFDDVDVNESKRASCIAIGVILHFFLISSFCFSLCITIVQFFIVYKSFKVFRFIYLKSTLFSFAVPTVIVAIIIGIDRHAYINPNKYCWLHSLYVIFGVIVPISIILLINIGLFFMIALSHSSLMKSRNKYLQKNDVKDEKGIKQEFLLILTCFVNTGLTWLFGFLVSIPGKDGWVYARFVYGLLFCLFNSTQGFQIFVTYFVISKRRRTILKKKVQVQIDMVKHKIHNRNNKSKKSVS